MFDLVAIKKDRVVTDSLTVAKIFEKNHKNILRDISNLECSERFNRLNFEPVEYVDNKNEKRPKYLITRDGFTFLAMGFTGKKAAKFKEDYISAFNAMEKALSNHKNTEWLNTRQDGKTKRNALTDAISNFKDYAISQGSKHADKYFVLLTQNTDKRLFDYGSGKHPKKLRDFLDSNQLCFLKSAEIIICNIIREGIAQEIPYKEIYQIAMKQVDKLVDAVGRTNVRGMIEEADRQARKNSIES